MLDADYLDAGVDLVDPMEVHQQGRDLLHVFGIRQASTVHASQVYRM